MEPLSFAIGIAVVILSIIFHEVAHGYVANWLGDPTAKYAGRLTLNPIPHIDPIGSIAIPGILALTGSPFLIGWAKPVPYNPYNLRHGKWGEGLVAFSGPLTNVIIAIIAGLLLRFSAELGLPALMMGVLVTAVYANLVLAIFNLIPIPPLDGSKVLRAFLPLSLARGYDRLEGMAYALGPFGLLAVGLVAIYLLWPVLSILVQWGFLLLVGA